MIGISPKVISSNIIGYEWTCYKTCPLKQLTCVSLDYNDSNYNGNQIIKMQSLQYNTLIWWASETSSRFTLTRFYFVTNRSIAFAIIKIHLNDVYMYYCFISIFALWDKNYYPSLGHGSKRLRTPTLTLIIFSLIRLESIMSLHNFT